jgi:ABC-type branched-subunit amino acid transport system substrate-binding protein
MRSFRIKATDGRSIFIASILTVNLLLTTCSLSPYKCTDPLGCLEIPSGSPIVIGTILATNGRMGSIGNATLQAIQDTIENRTLLGHPITLENQATECTPESAQTAATSLALDTNVLAVIGPTCNE